MAWGIGDQMARTSLETARPQGCTSQEQYSALLTERLPGGMTEGMMAPDDVSDLRRDIQHIMAELASIKTMIATEQQRCPHREEIARAANNTRRLADLEACVDRMQAAIEPLAMLAEQKKRLEKMEGLVDELRLSMAGLVARGGLAGGGVASAVAVVAAGVGKALGWW